MNTANENTGGGGAGYPTADGRRPPPALNELWYQRLADHSHDGIVVFGGDRIVYVNPAGVRGIGAQSSAELLGRRIHEFVHKDSMSSILSRFAGLREDGGQHRPRGDGAGPRGR